MCRNKARNVYLLGIARAGWERDWARPNAVIRRRSPGWRVVGLSAVDVNANDGLEHRCASVPTGSALMCCGHDEALPDIESVPKVPPEVTISLVPPPRRSSRGTDGTVDVLASGMDARGQSCVRGDACGRMILRFHYSLRSGGSVRLLPIAIRPGAGAKAGPFPPCKAARQVLKSCGMLAKLFQGAAWSIVRMVAPRIATLLLGIAVADAGAASVQVATQDKPESSWRQSIRIVDEQGVDVRGPGLCFSRATRVDQGPSLQAPRDATKVSFGGDAGPVEMQLIKGAHDVWIDVPGFAWFATTLEVDGDRGIVARLRREGAITIQLEGELHPDTVVTTSLQSIGATGPDQSYVRMTDSDSESRLDTWGRLPPGKYDLSIDLKVQGGLGKGDVAERHVEKRLTLSSGEHLVVPIDVTEIAPELSTSVTGLISIPHLWWRADAGHLMPEVTLFAAKKEQTTCIRTLVRRVHEVGMGGLRRYSWSSSHARPGEYIIVVEPMHSWATVVIPDPPHLTEVAIGAPSELTVRMYASESSAMLAVRRLSLAPRGMGADRVGGIWVNLTGDNEVAPVRIAQGQQITVLAQPNGPFLTQGLSIDVDSAECSVEARIAPERIVRFRLILDGMPVSRSLSWWTQNLSLKQMSTGEHVRWNARTQVNNEVEFRFPSAIPVQAVLGEDDWHAMPVLFPPAAASEGIDYREFKLIAR
jgi:hypothetical protein